MKLCLMEIFLKLRPFKIMLIFLLSLSGCYMPIEGRVIDAETGQPIEGAVVLVEWIKVRKLIYHGHMSYKVVEAVSGPDGTVKIEGCYSPFVEKPEITVYKKDYVGWSSKLIFPELKGRTDFEWGDNIFKLEKFKNTYSYVEHESFIHRAINVGMSPERKQFFLEQYQNGEEKLVIQERNNARSR